jgi:ankyrin repeat protein
MGKLIDAIKANNFDSVKNITQFQYLEFDWDAEAAVNESLRMQDADSANQDIQWRITLLLLNKFPKLVWTSYDHGWQRVYNSALEKAKKQNNQAVQSSLEALLAVKKARLLDAIGDKDIPRVNAILTGPLFQFSAEGVLAVDFIIGIIKTKTTSYKLTQGRPDPEYWNIIKIYYDYIFLILKYDTQSSRFKEVFELAASTDNVYAVRLLLELWLQEKRDLSRYNLNHPSVASAIATSTTLQHLPDKIKKSIIVKEGSTPLSRALAGADYETTQLLLDLGHDVYSKEVKLADLIRFATLKNKDEIISTIYKCEESKYIDLLSSIYTFKCMMRNGHQKVAELILQRIKMHHESAEVADALNTNYADNTLLGIAIDKEYNGLALMLVGMGAKLDKVKKSNPSKLQIFLLINALTQARVQDAEKILADNPLIKVSIKTFDNNTRVQLKNIDPELLKSSPKVCAFIGQLDKTPLTIALEEGNADAVRKVVNDKAFVFDTDAIDSIITAIRMTRPDLGEIILEKHSPPSLSIDDSTYDNKTAFVLAVEYQHHHLADLLRDHGASSAHVNKKESHDTGPAYTIDTGSRLLEAIQLGKIQAALLILQNYNPDEKMSDEVKIQLYELIKKNNYFELENLFLAKNLRVRGAKTATLTEGYKNSIQINRPTVINTLVFNSYDI